MAFQSVFFLVRKMGKEGGDQKDTFIYCFKPLNKQVVLKTKQTKENLSVFNFWSSLSLQRVPERNRKGQWAAPACASPSTPRRSQQRVPGR